MALFSLLHAAEAESGVLPLPNVVSTFPKMQLNHQQFDGGTRFKQDGGAGPGTSLESIHRT